MFYNTFPAFAPEIKNVSEKIVGVQPFWLFFSWIKDFWSSDGEIMEKDSGRQTPLRIRLPRHYAIIIIKCKLRSEHDVEK
jgi:hypothetical protein